METAIGIGFLVLFAALWDHPLILAGMGAAVWFVFYFNGGVVGHGLVGAAAAWPAFVTASMPVLQPLLIVVGAFVVVKMLWPSKKAG